MRSPSIEPETDLERLVLADRRLQANLAWGDPRPGHPEGTIGAHVAEVLARVEEEAAGRPAGEREQLRLVAIIHDASKPDVDYGKPRSGSNHHATIARRFAERYLDDETVLEIIETHDEAYNAWGVGHRSGRWDKAEARARRLVERLGDRLDLYMAFYRADNATGDKRREPLEWFERLSGRWEP